jgi:hypothetical protein
VDDETKKAILREILRWDGVPLREDNDFTMEEYRRAHEEEYGYPIPRGTARHRLDGRVEGGSLGTGFRYDPAIEDKRRVWWKKEQQE